MHQLVATLALTFVSSIPQRGMREMGLISRTWSKDRTGGIDELAEGYDVIGEVHGCATQLEALLNKPGYRAGASSAAYLASPPASDLRRRF